MNDKLKLMFHAMMYNKVYSDVKLNGYLIVFESVFIVTCPVVFVETRRVHPMMDRSDLTRPMERILVLIYALTSCIHLLLSSLNDRI